MRCGDDTCSGGENAQSCPEDCGNSACGDDTCDSGETPTSCPEDCGKIACGDGTCQPGEDTTSCSADCGTNCGDGQCNGAESSATCADDCGANCGDGTCNGTESSESCVDDCGTNCGDGTCNGTETTATCADDCGTNCGDGECNGSEVAATCSEDCGTNCGDGICNGAESTADCPADCGTNCGDGKCNGTERTATCSADCGAACGDDECNGSENASTCPQDCSAQCGDSVCTHDETASSCPLDCPANCGDNLCTGSETWETCLGDCPRPPTELGGIVVDAHTGEPLAGVQIRTEPPSETMLTDSEGLFSITLAPGFNNLMRVSAELSNYLVNFADVYISPEQTSEASLSLYPGTVNDECYPACASGWICELGTCRSLCGASCPTGQVCTGTGCVDYASAPASGCGDSTCSRDESLNGGVNCLPDCAPIFRKHPVEYNSSDNIHYVDVDGDGDVDQISVSCTWLNGTGGEVEVNVNENVGSPSAGPAWTGWEVRGQVHQDGAVVVCEFYEGPNLVADVDGDGAIEVIGYWSQDETLALKRVTYHQRGASFDFDAGTDLGVGLPASLECGGASSSCNHDMCDPWDGRFVFGNIDGDGKPDVFLVSYSGYSCDIEMTTFINIGTIAAPVWSARDLNIPYTTGGESQYSVTIGDVDGDGDGDFLYAIESNSATAPLLSLAVLRNDGGGWAGPEYFPIQYRQVHSTNDTDQKNMSLVDYDGSGYPNLIYMDDWYTDVIPRHGFIGF